MRRQPFQDVLEVGERINMVTLGVGQDAEAGRHRLATLIAPYEEPVLAIMNILTYTF
jgi:hypothetical protein